MGDPNQLGWQLPEDIEGGRCPRCKSSNTVTGTVCVPCDAKERKCLDCGAKWQESVTAADLRDAKEKGLI